MYSNSWVRIYRSITNSWVWNEKPFSYGQAWVDLILMANFKKNNQVALKGEIINQQPGDIVTSEQVLMEKWGWGKTKLRTFMKKLKIAEMIDYESTKKGTTLHVLNYGIYQNSRTTTKPQPNHSQTINKPQPNPINKVNKVKESSSDGASAAPLLSDIFSYIREHDLNVDGKKFFQHYTESGWKTKSGKPVTDWRRQLKAWDSMERREKPTYANGYQGVRYLGDPD